MAGSVIVDLSGAALGGRTCWRNWIGGVHSGVVCSLVASRIASMFDPRADSGCCCFCFSSSCLKPAMSLEFSSVHLPSRACTNMLHTISILRSTHLVLFGKRLLIGHLESSPEAAGAWVPPPSYIGGGHTDCPAYPTCCWPHFFGFSPFIWGSCHHK